MILVSQSEQGCSPAPACFLQVTKVVPCHQGLLGRCRDSPVKGLPLCVSQSKAPRKAFEVEIYGGGGLKWESQLQAQKAPRRPHSWLSAADPCLLLQWLQERRIVDPRGSSHWVANNAIPEPGPRPAEESRGRGVFAVGIGNLHVKHTRGHSSAR